MQTTAGTHEYDDIQAARDGDCEALQRVLAYSRQNLRRYAEYHCVVNDVEDAVQESLILVSRRITDLRVIEAFASWLFRIVKRECNRLKRGMRLLTGEAVSEDLLACVRFEPTELRQDVIAALQALPPHYREIILLRDLEGLSIDELAARLRIQPQAAKSRLHRARLLAREYLSA
ncbi:RNA polymerase sigma factor [Pseudoxanthomonas wuyuanensis]|uniref:RNA polymerase sigma factor, sigma-70 family n=1 Tax=Pseudoxanthomonas wuyuanensis TaxID=1073196 RepID=A0A286DG09_9GAMM|nr:RNA polymerase sigma factor [Pseudoxanthomonas wuyuanensis]KAF1718960.1 RNA polymerase sigma factor [Pseudoxanthomonas wuyuanensis]SOD57551.1 RNA polymerase sigma factor, sigma-70 family [Pseudoxanthomonas wuyuanensis]